MACTPSLFAYIFAEFGRLYCDISSHPFDRLPYGLMIVNLSLFSAFADLLTPFLSMIDNSRLENSA
jgi:hypothetical protein